MTEIEQLRESNLQKSSLIEMLEADITWQRFLRRASECKARLMRYTEGPFSAQIAERLEKINALLSGE